MEDKIRTAIIEELQRQADDRQDLKVTFEGDRLVVHGPVDLDTLLAAIEGSIAGGG